MGNWELIIESLDSVIPEQYELHDINDAWVDSYFNDRYNEYLRPTVIEYLTKAVAQFPDYLFVFTGHSLGAALTTLSAYDMVVSGYVPKA
jgi:predicted lipase